MADNLHDRYKKYLAIDRDGLDDCLIKQPELFYHVSEQYTLAVGRRDAAKLELEKVEAEISQSIRENALKREEKVTEAGIAEKITIAPRVYTLRFDLLQLKGEVDKWLAMKEAYQQRSFMLRELVPIHLSQLYSGTSSVRGDISEHNRKLAGEERVRRRLSRMPNSTGD